MENYDLMASPGALIRRAHQIGVSLFLSDCQGYDITPLQYSVMWAVDINPGIDQIGLTKLLALDRQTIAIIAKNLEKNGYIHRYVNPENKRAKQLFISKEGKKLFAEVFPIVQKVYEKLLEPLTEEEKKNFQKALMKITHQHNELSRAPMSMPPNR